MTHIKLPNILPEIFQIILRYIYGGNISLVEYDILDVVKILVAANELDLQELIPHLQSFLIENKETWIEQNFNLIYQISFENDSFLDLQRLCKELISKQPEKIFNSPDFNSISEKVLISLVQHDKIQMSEVRVWEHVLKWGIAQNPGLSSNRSSYSNDDFNTLKNTLKHCITYIKFTEFPPKEFLSKVYPYKEIIPEELYENSIKYFLDNDCKSRSERQTVKETRLKGIDSKIITIQHVELISKWIDRLEITDELKNSYEFKLIFRGSRDGFTAEQFHEICDNQSRTVTVFKVKGSDEILGGYNPIEWKNDYYLGSYGKTKDSFIFSFMSKEIIEGYLISRVKDENRAIFYLNNYGPSFGGGDLTIHGGIEGEIYFSTSYCEEESYEKRIRKTVDNFSIEEFEVFIIRKKIINYKLNL
ncbi:carbohydrate-binding module family 13 protein [Rhizophagus clarus]|nr:carbohydrate-binding module family 13 protein [Rhizophagus clarus]